jgi:hypothetical protein
LIIFEEIIKMQQLQDKVRAEIDALRFASHLQGHGRKDIVQALSDSVAFQSSVKDEDIRKGTIHMCPYSTCQATRHNISA